MVLSASETLVMPGTMTATPCRLFNLRHLLLILSCLDQPFNVTVQCTLHHVRDAFSVKALFSDLFATKARCCNLWLPLYNGSLWLVKCFCLRHQFLSQDNHQLPLETNHRIVALKAAARKGNISAGAASKNFATLENQSCSKELPQEGHDKAMSD